MLILLRGPPVAVVRAGHHFFALSPISTRRRMAPERPGELIGVAAHLSTLAKPGLGRQGQLEQWQL